MSSPRPKNRTSLALLGAALVLVLFVLTFALVRWTGHGPSAGHVESSAASPSPVPESSPRELEAPELAEGAERARDPAMAAGIPAGALSEADAARLALRSESYIARGRVVDAGGQPVAGAEVWFGCRVFEKPESSDGTEFGLGLGSGFRSLGSQRKTDAKGQFEFQLGGERDVLEVSARHDAHGVTARELSGPDVAGSVVDFGDLVLAAPLELRGRALRHWTGESTTTAEPFAGVELELYSDGTSTLHALHFRGKTPRTTAGADGTFVFQGLPPGRYRVVAQVDALGEPLAKDGASATPAGARNRGAPRTRTESMPSASAFLPTREPPLPVFVARRAVLRGRVVLPDGSAVFGADVGVHGPNGEARVRTDSDGRFEITGLGRAPLELRVWPPKSATGVLRMTRLDGVVPGARDMRVVLAAAAELVGLVVDARGEPEAFAGVTAISAMREELDFVYADEKGRFRLRVPAQEEVELEACPTEGNGDLRKFDRSSPWRARASRVRAGVSDLVLRLERK